MPRAGLIGLLTVLAAACAAPGPSESPASTAAMSSLPATSAEASVTTSPGLNTAWRALPDAPFARLEMATAAFEDRIWTVGGLLATGEGLTEVAILDPTAGTWSDGPSLPVPLHHAALVSDGERLRVVGGYVGSAFNLPAAETWVLEPGAESWAAGPSLPDPRAAGAAAWDGERIVYGGGVGPNGVEDEVYVLAGDAWEELGGLPTLREHLAAASDGAGTVWFLGGRVASLESNLADVALVTGDEITSIGELPTARGGVAAFFVPGIGGCLTGGEAPDRAFAEVECIDAAGRVTTLAPMANVRHGHGAAVVGSTAYVVLGGPTPGFSAHASVEALDIGGAG
jgi:hypothetical protein